MPGEAQTDSEGEPSIAVDPRDPRHIVVAWQQDRFNADGGALGTITAVTSDGGATWARSPVPALTRCTGGQDERASDPWLGFGPRGRPYLASLTFSETPTNPVVAGPTTLRVSTGKRGGRTWLPPVDVQPFDRTYNDREAVTGDPTVRGMAHYAFVKRLGVFGESGIEQYSRTTDGGRTWSSPRTIFAPPPGTLTDPTLIVGLPDGTLVNLVLVANLSPFLPPPAPRVPWQVVALRSTDHGETWSAPVTVGSLTPAAPVDPTSGAIVRAYNLISAAASPDGVVYVAWNEIRSFTDSSVFVSRSRDGGATWSPPAAAVRVPTQAFLPSIAVSRDGTVGITFDDFRRDVVTDDQLTTDVWFVRSRDRGRTWKGSHVAGPFDLLTAPRSDSSGVAGIFVGDYQALVGLEGRDFLAAFSATEPLARFGGTDVFVARLRG